MRYHITTIKLGHDPKCINVNGIFSTRINTLISEDFPEPQSTLMLQNWNKFCQFLPHCQKVIFQGFRISFLSTGQSKITEFSRAFMSSYPSQQLHSGCCGYAVVTLGGCRPRETLFPVLSLNTKKSFIHIVSHRCIQYSYVL